MTLIISGNILEFQNDLVYRVSRFKSMTNKQHDMIFIHIPIEWKKKMGWWGVIAGNLIILNKLLLSLLFVPVGINLVHHHILGERLSEIKYFNNIFIKSLLFDNYTDE